MDITAFVIILVAVLLYFIRKREKKSLGAAFWLLGVGMGLLAGAVWMLVLFEY